MVTPFMRAVTQQITLKSLSHTDVAATQHQISIGVLECELQRSKPLMVGQSNGANQISYSYKGTKKWKTRAPPIITANLSSSSTG
jgi:hypothetical protein